MDLTKISSNAPKVPELVMNSLLDAIETGKIKIGDELPPERELVEVLGVGRGSIRESLAVLDFMGIIETRGNRKVVVKNAEYFRKAISLIRASDEPDTFMDFMEFRRSSEVEIARLAAKRATPEDLSRLESILFRMEKNPSDVMADVEFHTSLALASHNIIFATILDFVNLMILELRMRYHEREDYHERTLKAHRDIFNAVRDGNAEIAALEMGKHLSAIEEYHEAEDTE